MSTNAVLVMSMETLHQSKEFLVLTDKQKVWVDTFIQTRDPSVATITAYGGHTSPTYRRMLAEKVAASPNVWRCLDLAFGRSFRDRFLLQIERDMKKANGIALARLRELYARVSGLLPSSETETDEVDPGPTFSIGEKVTQRDDAGLLHVGVVKSIDAHGEPVIEEIQ